MASVKEVQDVIMSVAGNPATGAVKQLAPEMARRIVELDSPKDEKPKAEKPKPETRVVEATEVR